MWFISKKSFQRALENEVRWKTTELEGRVFALKKEIKALEGHIEFLNNHVSRHSNCRERAEKQLNRVYEVAVGAAEKMVSENSIKELLESLKAARS